MSFNITVVAGQGTAAVSTSGEVPDGEFMITGHEDDQSRSMGLTRRGPDGRYVQQATAVHHKEHG